MLQVNYKKFSPRCRKSHVKQQIQYEPTCFSPFLATRCLHVANDFRVFSQLSLPICRLSAYTLCVRDLTLLMKHAFGAKYFSNKADMVNISQVFIGQNHESQLQRITKDQLLLFIATLNLLFFPRLFYR